ncbi:MAG TPA: hypothetical protein VGA37_01650 [Gemmatimonadales bacterium]
MPFDRCDLPPTRREFIVTAAAALAGARPRAVSVEAVPTVFYEQPGAGRSRIRFFVRDAAAAAAAGRLRVFDMRSRLLATAGVVRRGADLVGEVWLPLDAPTRIRSELEMPGTRGPVRSTHALAPKPRWTIYWVTVTDPVVLRARLEEVAPLLRGAESAMLFASGVRAHPLSLSESNTPIEHLAFARAAFPALDVAREYGIPAARIVSLAPRPDIIGIERVLSGSGITDLVDGTRAADPGAAGLAVDRRIATSAIEAWLETLAPTGAADPIAIVVGADAALALRSHGALGDWNARYAFPQIVLHEPPGGAVAAGVEPARVPPSRGWNPVPLGADARTAVADDLEQRRRDRAARIFEPLASLVAAGHPTLDGIAARFAFPVGGVMVFNPAPFGRSDVVELPDGTAKVVTNVPALGYAFIPETRGTDGAPVAAAAGARTVESALFQVRINDATGALQSVVMRETGRELVGMEGGICAIEGARLVATTLQPLPGVGSRLQVRRRVAGAAINTTVTVYDLLPWVDVENTPSEPGHAGDYRLAFAEPTGRVRWEATGGATGADAPIAVNRHLRWLALDAAAGTVLVATPDSAYAGVDDDGTLTVHGGGGRTRVRIGYRGFLLSDDPWRFGWSTEPFLAVPSAGTGTSGLPSFGRMVDIKDPGVAVLTLKRADDGVGVVGYMQELMGVARGIAILPGLLRFDALALTDLIERDRGMASRGPEGGAIIPVEPYGFTAFRLLGVTAG